MTHERIAELRALRERATNGEPWAADVDCFDHPPDDEIRAVMSNRGVDLLFTAGTEIMSTVGDSCDPDCWDKARASQPYRDAQLIAAAVNSLPELLAMADALVELVAAKDALVKAQALGYAPEPLQYERMDDAWAEAKRLVSGGEQ